MSSVLVHLARLMWVARQELPRWEQYQRARLREFARVLSGSRYHLARLASLGLAPADLVEPTQLDALPVMERSDLQRCLTQILTPQAAGRGVRSLRTSGSSGVPLQTWITAEEGRVRQALQLRGRLLAGRRPWYREAVIGSFPPTRSAGGRHPALRWSLYLPATADSEALLAQLHAFAPHYIVAFPSTLLRLGESPGLRPRLITTGSEVLQAADRMALERRFGAPVRDIYGAIETGLLAFQCRVGEGYHLNADVVHFEFRPVQVPLDRTHEILVTPLYARAAPLVRYRLGDVVQLMDGRCPCGCTLPRIAAIQGRCDDWLQTPDGREVPPAAVRALFRGDRSLAAYRITQDLDLRLRLEVVLGEMDRATVDSLVVALAALVQQPVELHVVDVIQPEPSGKLRAIRRRLIRET